MGIERLMRLPFVSRERYAEQQAELARVRSELAAEREKNQRLWNFLNWRVGGGVAFDTSQLPEAYQPRTVTQPAVPASGDDTAKPMRAVRAPGQARREIAQFEVQAEDDFQRAHIGQRPARVSKQQIELVNALNDAAHEGQKAAGGE